MSREQHVPIPGFFICLYIPIYALKKGSAIKGYIQIGKNHE